jgi:hypothetical protein
MPGAGRLAGVAAAVAIAVAACGGSASDSADDPPAPAAATAQGSSFLQTMRGGGNVIAFRHAITDQSHQDEARFRYDECARQRNLSAAGRTQARAIGRAIRRLDIPIGASSRARTAARARRRGSHSAEGRRRRRGVPARRLAARVPAAAQDDRGPVDGARPP